MKKIMSRKIENKKIKCMNCNHIWESGAKQLTSRGVYCRSCGEKENLAWVSGYTDTELKYTSTHKSKTDFLMGVTLSCSIVPISFSRTMFIDDRNAPIMVMSSTSMPGTIKVL